MRLVITLFMLGISNQIIAWPTAKDALKEFIRLETSGGRINEWEFGKYLIVASDYEEPGWDMIELVDSYKIIAHPCMNQICSFEVIFNLTPTSEIDDQQVVSHPDGGVARVKYDAIKIGSEWRLKPVFHVPIISYEIYKVKYKNL